MAHDCLECGGLCYCDLEDAMSSIAPDDCIHECPLEEDEDQDDLAREEFENATGDIDPEDDIPF